MKKSELRNIIKEEIVRKFGQKLPTLADNIAVKSLKEGDDKYNVVDEQGKIIDDGLPKRVALKLAAKKKGWKIQKAVKEVKKLAEGTWSFPKNRIEGVRYIKATEKFKNGISKVFGDDIVLDGFDAAIARMKLILDFPEAKEYWSKNK